ncbi:MAG: acylphosphatase [Candidatus Methanoperedens sp.]
MERRAEIVLKGRVQKAGFRDYIDEVAFELELKGWVKNIEDGTVKVVCEGRSKEIDAFVNKIKIREYPIRVDDAEVKYSPATGEFEDFTIIREDDVVFATYERMDAAGRYMREMNNNLGGKLDKMLDKQDQMLGKQDKMLDGQYSLFEVTDRGFKEMQKGFGEVKDELSQGFGDMRVGFADVKEEMHLMRDDFRKVFMTEVNELRSEINELRQAVTRIERGMVKGTAYG